MIDDFIKMIDNIDFLYGFIYECANLIYELCIICTIMIIMIIWL